jgi:amidase
VPQQGIVPISHSQDTAGPMATTVRDAAALLTVLSGGREDYAAACAGTDVAGMRVGVPREPHLWGFTPALDELTEQALALLSANGVTIVDGLALPDSDHETQLTVLHHEFKVDLAAYLKTRDESAPKTLADVIAYNAENAAAELEHFGQDLFERSEATGGLTAPEYVAARLAGLAVGRRGIDDLLRQHELDALVMPGYPPAWTIDLVNGDQVNGGNCSTHAALAGYPLVSVPSGTVAGLPVALTLAGTHGSETKLISLAHAFELARGSKHGPFPRPEFVPWL